MAEIVGSRKCKCESCACTKPIKSDDLIEAVYEEVSGHEKPAAIPPTAATWAEFRASLERGVETLIAWFESAQPGLRLLAHAVAVALNGEASGRCKARRSTPRSKAFRARGDLDGWLRSQGVDPSWGQQE